MRYEVTTLSRVCKDCGALLEANHRESGMLGHPLRADAAQYEALDRQTPSFAIVAFDGDRAVGVSAVLIGVHPHTSTLFAQNDTLFVLPPYRARSVGGILFVKSEREAKRRGAETFLWTCPIDSPLAVALEKRCPRVNRQILFQKEL